MDSDEEVGAALFCLLKKRLDLTKKRSRRYKTRPINRDRKAKGFFATTFLTMKQNDPAQFFKYTRMSRETFEDLLEMVKPIVKKKSQYGAISPEEKLAIVLHSLSQGSSMQTIAWKYKLGKTTIHVIIKEMCSAIFTVLESTYLKSPNTNAEWLKIADGFWNKWNFPNCLGAIDGKHIQMRAPKNSGSLFFNYKKTFSIVLLAVCDFDYNFTMVDIGSHGSSSDAGIFQDSSFAKIIDENYLNFPPDSQLPHSNNQQKFPYGFVGDAAFPLDRRLMRPYAGLLLPEAEENFNKRLSRARRVIENCFGILAARWRVLLQTINADVELVESIVKACLCLHNFLRQKTSTYLPPGFVDIDDNNSGLWRTQLQQNLLSVRNGRRGNTKHNAMRIRDGISNFLLHEARLDV